MVDTFFELQLENAKIREEQDKLVRKKNENSKHLENILKKVKLGYPLTTEDILLLDTLIKESGHIGNSLAWNQHKAKKVAQLFEAYQDEIPWGEAVLNGANSAINFVANLFKLGDFESVAEKPDGKGETFSSSKKKGIKKFLGLRPADVRRTHQELPYALDYYDY